MFEDNKQQQFNFKLYYDESNRMEIDMAKKTVAEKLEKLMN